MSKQITKIYSLTLYHVESNNVANYSLFHLSRIRECRKGSSQSVLTHCSMIARWIWYHDQLPWVTNVYKIKFGCVANLSNYGYFSIKFECCDISEKNVVILIIFGIVIRYNVLAMFVKQHLAQCPICEQLWALFHKCVFIVISGRTVLIILIFGTIISYHVLLTYVKYPLAIYMANVANYANIFSSVLCLL